MIVLSKPKIAGAVSEGQSCSEMESDYRKVPSSELSTADDRSSHIGGFRYNPALMLSNANFVRRRRAYFVALTFKSRLGLET